MQRFTISEYDEHGKSPLGLSAVGAAVVAPNDGTDLANGTAKGFYVGGAGNIAVVMADGSTATFTGIAVGTVHNIAIKRVMATGTTATGIVALY